jgi:hypothetical protein
LAADKGNLGAVDVLLKQGVDVDSRYLGSTPLFSACGHCHYDVIKLLLENKADPNSRNISGYTPLQAALDFFRFRELREKPPDINVLKLLLDYGANPDVNMPGNKGWTAVKWFAQVKKDLEVAMILREHGAVIDPTIDSELKKVDISHPSPTALGMPDVDRFAGPVYFFIQIKSNIQNPVSDYMTHGLEWMPAQENVLTSESSLVRITTPAICIFSKEELAREFIVQSRNKLLDEKLPTGVVDFNILTADVEYIQKMARKFNIGVVVMNPVYRETENDEAKATGVTGDRIVNIKELS